MILNSEEIMGMIKRDNLITDYVDLNKQLTPNGFDLTVEKVFGLLSSGAIDFSNRERRLPETREIVWKRDWILLNKDVYKVRTNEIIKMPLDLVAIARPRSSLSRSGVTVDTGVWDAGFEGKSEFLLTVGNNKGFKIKKNARIAQLIFFRIKKTKKGYNGIYKSII
jgi:dUTP pyrophosphatase